MSSHDINIRIEPIANGFLLSANATADGGYRTVYTDRIFVSSREEATAQLVSLYEQAEALNPADAKDDF